MPPSILKNVISVSAPIIGTPVTVPHRLNTNWMVV
jgi:hypothetical protein